MTQIVTFASSPTRRSGDFHRFHILKITFETTLQRRGVETYRPYS